MLGALVFQRDTNDDGDGRLIHSELINYLVFAEQMENGQKEFSSCPIRQKMLGD